MALSFTTQSLKELLVFPFRDAQWQGKLGIAFLVFLISPLFLFIPGLVFGGYIMKIMRRVIVEDGQPYLPEWEDWGKLFTDGLRLFGAGFLISLPWVLLLFLGYGLMMLPAFAAPLFETEDYFGLFFMLSTLLGWGFMGVGILATQVLGVISPAALCHLVEKDSFEAAFRITEWWPILRANLGGFVLSYLIVIGGMTLFTVIGQFLLFTLILCWVYPLAILLFQVYFGLIWNVLFARAYREGKERLAGQVIATSAAV